MGIFDGLFSDILGNVGGSARTGANTAVTGLSDAVLNMLGLGMDTSNGTGVYQNLWDRARSLSTPQYPQVEMQNNTWTPGTVGWTNQGPAQGYTAQNWNANQIVEDPAMRNQQLANLTQYQNLANQGFDEIDRAQNARALQDAAAQSQRQSNAIIDSMQQRGMTGGGQELLQRQLASQGASEQAYRTGLGLAEENRNRRAQNLASGTNLAGNIRSTDLGVNAKNVAAENEALQNNAYMNTLANRYLAEQGNQINQFNTRGQNATALENFNAANTAGRFNATNANEIQRSNRDYELNRIRNQTADELQQFNAMMGAGRLYGDQLNAAEAARKKREYAQNMGASGQYGTGQYGTPGINPNAPYGSGNTTGNNYGFKPGQTLDPNQYGKSWTWTDMTNGGFNPNANSSTLPGELPPSSWGQNGTDLSGNAWDGYGNQTYVPPSWSDGNYNYDYYWGNPNNSGDYNAGNQNMGSNEPGQAWYSPDGASPGSYGNVGVNDPRYGQNIGKDPYGNTIIDPSWGPGNASYDQFFGNVTNPTYDTNIPSNDYSIPSNDYYIQPTYDTGYDYSIQPTYDTGDNWFDGLGDMFGGGYSDGYGGGYSDGYGGGYDFGGYWAKGGKAPMGKLSIVGENGPEAIIPGKDGTKVIPNDELENYFFPPKYNFTK